MFSVELVMQLLANLPMAVSSLQQLGDVVRDMIGVANEEDQVALQELIKRLQAENDVEGSKLNERLSRGE
jgi:hypothetical protein